MIHACGKNQISLRWIDFRQIFVGQEIREFATKTSISKYVS